jgi:hypothetical protein
MNAFGPDQQFLSLHLEVPLRACAGQDLDSNCDKLPRLSQLTIMIEPTEDSLSRRSPATARPRGMPAKQQFSPQNLE